MVPFVKVRLVAPKTGAKVGVPQPEVLTVGVAQTARPTGRVSVKLTPLRVVAVLGFTTLKVRVA